MAVNDRLEITFTSDVSQDVRENLVSLILADATDAGLFIYKTASTVQSNVTTIDIAAHDRETFDLTDGQVMERLRVKAAAQGLSVIELLRRLAVE